MSLLATKQQLSVGFIFTVSQPHFYYVSRQKMYSISVSLLANFW